ncbi:MAG: hypothetical protein L6407_09125 [Candidatus Delongbacteria bacterium]|nr:hypothetical protein [Candidatus Delongbacteria bacterium]
MGKKEIKFTYIKNNSFKVHHIDGLNGGLTPRGDVILNFFSERFPIPKEVTYELEGNMLGKELKVESKEGIIREVECGIVVDYDTAVSISAWLEKQLKQLKKLKEGK